jgi:DNA-binding transcriptional regulator GbsR (MarR family)
LNRFNRLRIFFTIERRANGIEKRLNREKNKTYFNNQKDILVIFASVTKNKVQRLISAK